MSEELRKKIYSRILRSVRDRLGERNETRLCERLRPQYDALWSSYRASVVGVPYDNEEIVAGYLLAYFPMYAFMAIEALRPLEGKLPNNVRALAVCGGPCPEVIGMASALANSSLQGQKSVALNVVDHHATAWRWAGEVAEQLSNEFFPTVRSSVSYCDEPIVALAAATVAVHVVIFQNCLNELTTTANLWTALSLIMAAQAPNSFLIFADRDGYYAVDDALKEIRSRAIAAGYAILEDVVPLGGRPNIFVPEVVDENFFYGRPERNPDGSWKNDRSRMTTIRGKLLVVRKDG